MRQSGGCGHVIRFIADDMVGRLARLLRLSGFDCAYHKVIEDAILARIAEDEQRVVLTRDTRLGTRYPKLRVFVLPPDDPVAQLRMVKEAFHLNLEKDLFSRCLECNTPLVPLDKEKVVGKVPPAVLSLFEEFSHCPGCQRVYWPGSHHDRMRERLAGWLKEWQH